MTIPRPPSRQPLPDTAQRVYKGKLFEVYQWEQRLFDGSLATFEKLKRPDTAYVIPVTAAGKLVLARQRQPGAAPVVGLLGGRIEDGETPNDAARRELYEEAGLAAGELTLWDSFQFLPKIEWAIYVFVARDCAPAGEQALDAGESIGLIEVSFGELLKLVADEAFGDVEIALRILRASQDEQRLQALRALLT